MITLREEKGTQLTHQEMDENFKSVMGGHNFLHIQDQKPQGTHGGTFTSGAWRTRDLNTVLTNTITGASLAANQITLPAGKYYVEASAPAWGVRRHQAKIQRVSEIAATMLLGKSRHHTGGSTPAVLDARVSGQFELDSEATIELQHRSQDTVNNSGFGVACNFTTEVYSDIRIWRIGEYVTP